VLFSTVITPQIHIIHLLAIRTRHRAAAFIKNFARPTSLIDIPAIVHPTYLAFDIGSLRDMFYGEEASARLVRRLGENFVELNEATGRMILNDLDRHFSTGHDGDGYSILNPEDGLATGKVSIGKTRISLPGFTRASIADIYVEDALGDAGTETKRKPLARFLDQEDEFILLFSDLTLAYIDGSFFHDDALLAGGATFMAHLRALPSLADTTGEKGQFTRGQTPSRSPTVARRCKDVEIKSETVPKAFVTL
jgi:hypothetical protein